MKLVDRVTTEIVVYFLVITLPLRLIDCVIVGRMFSLSFANKQFCKDFDCEMSPFNWAAVFEYTVDLSHLAFGPWAVNIDTAIPPRGVLGKSIIDGNPYVFNWNDRF